MRHPARGHLHYSKRTRRNNTPFIRHVTHHGNPTTIIVRRYLHNCSEILADRVVLLGLREMTGTTVIPDHHGPLTIPHTITNHTPWYNIMGTYLEVLLRDHHHRSSHHNYRHPRQWHRLHHRDRRVDPRTTETSPGQYQTRTRSTR